VVSLGYLTLLSQCNVLHSVGWENNYVTDDMGRAQNEAICILS
jgi:hypothetical protein